MSRPSSSRGKRAIADAPPNPGMRYLWPTPSESEHRDGSSAARYDRASSRPPAARPYRGQRPVTRGVNRSQRWCVCISKHCSMPPCRSHRHAAQVRSRVLDPGSEGTQYERVSLCTLHKPVTPRWSGLGQHAITIHLRANGVWAHVGEYVLRDVLPEVQKCRFKLRTILHPRRCGYSGRCLQASTDRRSINRNLEGRCVARGPFFGCWPSLPGYTSPGAGCFSRCRTVLCTFPVWRASLCPTA